MMLFASSNRKFKIFDVNFNDASFETKEFFMQNKENELFFILQCNLNTVVVLRTTSRDHFHVFRTTSALGVKKAVT